VRINCNLAISKEMKKYRTAKRDEGRPERRRMCTRKNTTLHEIQPSQGGEY
jgi:hypothetical protein